MPLDELRALKKAPSKQVADHARRFALKKRAPWDFMNSNLAMVYTEEDLAEAFLAGFALSKEKV